MYCFILGIFFSCSSSPFFPPRGYQGMQSKLSLCVRCKQDLRALEQLRTWIQHLGCQDDAILAEESVGDRFPAELCQDPGLSLNEEKVLSARWEHVSVAPHRLRGVTAWEYRTYYGLQGKSILRLHKTCHRMFRGGTTSREREG